MRVGQICLDCEFEISGIILMVDLRVVDILGFDVILDIDELITHRVVSDCDLRRVIIPSQSWCCIRLHMRMCMEFREIFFLRGGECETPENPNFRKRVKQ